MHLKQQEETSTSMTSASSCCVHPLALKQCFATFTYHFPKASNTITCLPSVLPSGYFLSKSVPIESVQLVPLNTLFYILYRFAVMNSFGNL